MAASLELPLACGAWVLSPVLELVPIVHAGLLWTGPNHEGTRDAAVQSCYHLATYMFFCGFCAEGCKIMEVLEAQAVANPTSKSQISISTKRFHGLPHWGQRLMLETIWSRRPDLRFGFGEWAIPWSPEAMEEKRMEMRRDECQLSDAELATDSHAWRTLSDPLIASRCAQQLSRPVDGHWPNDEAVGEARAAMKKQQELGGGPSPSLEIDLALRTSAEDAKTVLERILSGFCEDERADWMPDCLCFREDITSVTTSLRPGLLKLTKEDADRASTEIIRILEQEVDHIRLAPPPLAEVGWKDLLERYARAAFEVFDEHWEETEVERWEDILRPPATEEEIRLANGRLKGLPDDFKEMVAAYNGFKGPSNVMYLGGGCQGIDLASLEDTADVEIELFDPPPDRVTTDAEGRTVYVSEFGGGVNGLAAKTKGHTIRLYPEGEDYDVAQWIVPRETWKRNGDPQAAESEYRYVQTDEGATQWMSFRHYVGEMVVALETTVAVRRAAVE